jgi:hypothetical protein
MEWYFVLFMGIILGLILAFIVFYFAFIKNKNIENKGINNAILENNYLQGKRDGAAEALKRLCIRYDGYIEENNTFFAKYIETGYYSQLMLDGIPISERTKNVIKIVKESKDQNVEKMIDEINESLEKAVKLVSGFGVNAISGQGIKKLIKKKKDI